MSRHAHLIRTLLATFLHGTALVPWVVGALPTLRARIVGVFVLNLVVLAAAIYVHAGYRRGGSAAAGASVAG